ncbi:MAG: thioredoxin family protein [Gemmatimonadota bacterium]
MARTPSTMLPLGTEAGDFSLPDTEGGTVSLDDFAGKPGLVVMFICNHCPYVKHLREGLRDFGREYTEKGLGIVAISSNDVERYPADSPEKMAEEQEANGWVFPYLYDEDQEVAKEYRAACTPDFFLFDADRKLVYRGQFDGSRPGNDVPVTGEDLRRAADAVLEGRQVPADQQSSVGCNIKWKPGNEPG